MIRLFGHFVPVDKLVLLAIDVLLVGFTTYSLLLLDEFNAPITQSFIASIDVTSVFALVVILSLVAMGLYSDEASNFGFTASRIILALLLVVPVFLVIGLLLRHIYGTFNVRLVWFVETALAWFLCVLLSRIGYEYARVRLGFKRRVLVWGTGDRAGQIQAIVQAKSRACRFLPVAFVAAPNEARSELTSIASRIDSRGDLRKLAGDHRATEVVIAIEDRRGLPVSQLLQCKIAGIRVTDYLSFIERENGRIDLDALQPSWLIFSDGFRTGWLVKSVKRLFDIIVSIAFLIFTLPILLITAALVKLDGGPILYVQERVGQFGKPFALLKFRSMCRDAESAGAPVWAGKRDPRVTKIGALIRKVRIDELPQLINVLRGEMSFIGPRPERPFFVKQLVERIPFYNERHAAKPGISGWAQINYPYGASIEDARKKLEFDLYYVKNCTLFLDFLILVRTVRVILFPAGAR